MSKCSHLALEDACGTHASTDAHAYNAKALLRALKLAHESADHAAASHAEWVTEGDGTTLRVQLGGRHAELLHAVASLGGEGLVNLEDVNIIHAEASTLESLGDGKGGSNAHNLRWDTSDGKSNDSADDFAAVLLSDVSAGEQDA